MSVVTISPDAAEAVAVALDAMADTPRRAAEVLRRAGPAAHLDPLAASAVGLLDEIDEEVSLLGELLRVHAHLARSADRFSPWLDELLATVLARLGASLADEVGVTAVPFAPTAGWTPARVRSWWRSLNDEQRAQLTATRPDLVGNTDGIPVDDRIVANRVAMQRLLDGPVGDVDPRLVQFVGPDGRLDPERRFVVFDPTGDGFAAEVFGDVSTASSLAIVVPGMGSELWNFSRVSGDAATLHAGHPDVAVIAWTGYDAPAGLTAPTSPGAAWTDVRAAWEVSGEWMAARGGARLHRFADGLALDGDGTVTVIGHSYGSLTVGHAIRQGLRADRVVFIGSPGVGVDRVDEFPAGNVGEFFAAEVHGDPVADLQRFGDAPTDPDFGATVFDAGEPDGVALSLHGEYFDDGVAIENLRTIVRGGEPTGDRPPLINYLTEPWSDLDLPFVPFDDVAPGIVENAGAHLEDAVTDGAERLRDGAVDLWNDRPDWLPF